jgi:hypothetical protein
MALEDVRQVLAVPPTGLEGAMKKRVVELKTTSPGGI